MVRAMRRGTTLLELLVACTLFVAILTAVLSFYVYASNVTRRQEAISEGYRRTVQRLDKLETMLARSRVYQVTSTSVIFEPMPDLPSISRRRTDFSGETRTVYVLANRVGVRGQQGDYTLFMQLPGESVSFALSGSALTIRMKGTTHAAGHPPYSLDRTVILENRPPI